MLRKTRDLVIFRDPRFYASFPAVAALPDGQAIVLFRRGRDPRGLFSTGGAADDLLFQSVDHVDPRSQLVLVRLSRELEPLGEPEILPPDPEAADQDANLVLLRDGTLLLGSFAWYPLPAQYAATLEKREARFIGSAEKTGCLFLFWGGFIRTSVDGGRTWTPHNYLPPIPGEPEVIPEARPFLGGGVRGRPVETPEGEVLLATYSSARGTPRRSASHLFCSRDKGKTWHYRNPISHDADGKTGFAEPALYLTSGGRLIAFHRSFGCEDRLLTAISEDRGRTWLPWRRHRITGHPFDPLPLRDGRLLLVYGYRHPPYGIRARLVDGECEHIDEGTELILRDDGPSPDIGYPWATELADGRILVVYYFCDGEGVRHIAGSLLEWETTRTETPGSQMGTAPRGI